MAEFTIAVCRNINPEAVAEVAAVMPRTLDAVQKRLEDADDRDHWGNPYLGKQTSAVIERRVKKGG